MRNKLTVLAVALALLVGLTSAAQAQTPTDPAPACDYARAIAGCKRTVIVLDTLAGQRLPDGAVTYSGSVHGFPAICAHVGFDQTWCELVSSVPAKVSNPQPGVVVDSGVVCEVRQGLTYCSTARTPNQPVPSFTG